MNIQPIILAAGKGTRMGGEKPKVLVPLHGRPMISHLLQRLNFLNLPHKSVIVVGYKADEVKQALGENYLYALQEPQLGTGHAVSVAKSHVTAPYVMVLNGDHPFVSPEFLQKLYTALTDKDSVMAMGTVTVENFDEWRDCYLMFGRIIRSRNGDVVAIREYKDASTQERKIREVNLGFYALKTDWLFDQLEKIDNKNAQGEYYLTDVVSLALQSGFKVPTVDIDPVEAMGINSPEHLEQAHILTQGSDLVFA